MKIPSDPFVVGSTVEATSFLGRQDVAAWLSLELKDGAIPLFVLYGPRAIGKTSLLHYLQTSLAADAYVPVYYELADQPLDQLLNDLAQLILEQTNLELPLPESSSAFHPQFFPHVQQALGSTSRLVLLLDDMEKLPGDHAFWTIVPSLRGESPPALVFTTGCLPGRLPPKLKSMVKGMPARELGGLEEEAAIAVLGQGGTRLDFTEEGIARTLAWSGGHPYLLQLIGQYLWETVKEPTAFGEDEVESAIRSLAETAASSFEPLWEDLDIAEQLYVAVLARQVGPFEAMGEARVAKAIDAQVVRLRPHKMNWTAGDLVERQILSLDEAEQYHFRWPIFQAWVRHHKPPLLVKEQLDRVINPPADELFQSGREALISGQHQRATSYFRQAISDNPYHVGAQLALGSSLLALGFVETAVQRLERAYKLDKSEAKYPLAEALVVMAETHLKADNRRGALVVCERFRSLDSHNPEWLERIAAVERVVWNQRGDIALQRGFIDKALSAYSKAGNHEKVAELDGDQQQIIEPSNELEREAKALMQAEAWPEAVAAYEKLLGITQDAARRAGFQKALAQCLEEVEMAQYFDEGVKALENKNWLLARMSFMHIITRRMNYMRHGERALALLDKAAKSHSFTSLLVPSEVNVATGPFAKRPGTQSPEMTPAPEDASSAAPIEMVSPTPKVATGDVIRAEDADQVAYLERLGKGAITKMAYSPDGSLLALATALGVYFYDAQSLVELRCIETGIPVQAVAFSPDSTMIATGSWHHMVQLWRVGDGKLVANLEAHDSPVQTVAFSPEGKALASADEDGVIAIWRVDSVQLGHSWEAHRGPITAVAFSPHGDKLLSCSLDRTISLWQVESGTQLMSLQKHEEAVSQVVFAPDGQRFFSASRDRTAALWRLDETSRLRLRRQQEVRATLLYSLAIHHQAVNDIACSPDGRLVATASSDYIVRLWNADNGALLHEFKGHVSPVIAVAFSPDGQTLASATESLVQFWEVSTRYSGRAIEGHMGALQSVAVSADGRLLATAVDNRILVWSLEDQTLRHILLGHSDLIYRIAFSSQGNMLASASADKTVRLWNVMTGLATQTIAGHQGAVMDVSFAPNGQLLATASEAQTIRLWRTADGNLLQTLTGHQDAVTTVCFNSTGRLLASGSSDQTIKLWAIPEGRLQQTLTGHSGIIWQVTFSDDDKLLASAALDRTARLWQVEGGHLRHILDKHEGPVWSVHFSPNGQMVASGASDNKVRLWDALDGSLLRVFDGHTAPVSSVTFTPNGEKLISASADGTMRVQGIVK